MRTPLWTPSRERIEGSNIEAFRRFCERKTGKTLPDYDALYDFSVTEIELCWELLWDFFDVKCSHRFDSVADDLNRFPGVRWFEGAYLNYAENMLRHSDKKEPVLVFVGENSQRREIYYDELYSSVARLAGAFRRDGIKPGDRVVAYMPNLPETVIAFLAASAVGAVFCSCATDIGSAAAIDRLGQVDPKILVSADGYYYKGKTFSTKQNLSEIAASIPSLEHVVVTHYAGDNDISGVAHAVAWDEYTKGQTGEQIVFEQLPASHPLVVMFSSGTTGKPKCMVQTAAGLLLNQLKELQIHSEIDRRSTLLYITTCSWMMWNWQTSALATGATIVLYDGNPSYPDTGAIWRIVENERVTAFGLSASYVHALMHEGFSPKKSADLSRLECVLQTGSALSFEGFEYIYREVKSDLHLSSIAGGTDINGCFGIGNVLSPVYAGELQKAGLCMKINCYDDAGKPLRDETGELVCEAPAPSMPLAFWNDTDGKRYHDAYFGVYEGVWRHGDYVLIHGDTCGITFYGRSDSVLKPAGVRIGTAEIYNQVAKLPEIEDSLAIGQNWQGDQRIVLFVKLKSGCVLDDKLISDIKSILRTNASPRHVPSRIFAVTDIPRTFNGKKVESAVTNIVNGRNVTNLDALENPASLECYKNLLDELSK